jgi:ABC-type branched-subunit amino acid transport system permease subunit
VTERDRAAIDRARTDTSLAAAYAPVGIVAVLLAVVPMLIGDSPYLLSLATSMLVLACYAIALNVAFGLTGQLLLCLGALAGVSAYTSVILTDDHAWSMAVSIPLGTALATALGASFSWVAVRRQLDAVFVGVVTLAFSLVFANVVQGMRGLTGGETGRVVGAGATTPIRSAGVAYALFVALVLLLLFVFRLVQRSRLGWAFRALRDDEVAAELVGIDAVRHRVAAGALASAMLGLTGALWAHHDGFVSPTVYGFAHVDVRALVALSLGGIGSLTGPVVGAAAVAVMDEVLRPLGQLRLTVYGASLLVLFLVRRSVPTDRQVRPGRPDRRGSGGPRAADRRTHGRYWTAARIRSLLTTWTARRRGPTR